MLMIAAALDHEISGILDKMDVDATLHVKPAVIRHGHLGPLELLLLRSGMGVTQMQDAILATQSYFPITAICNVGYAGGTHPNLHLGDVVIPDQVVHKGEAWQCDATLASTALRYCEDEHLRFHRGTMVCSDTTIESPHEKAYLGTQFEAVSIDMESAGVARAAQKLGVPFMVMRAVVDPLDMALPHIPAPIVAKGFVRPLMMMAHLICNPRQLLRLPKLHFASNRARESVTETCLGLCARIA